MCAGCGCEIVSTFIDQRVSEQEPQARESSPPGRRAQARTQARGLRPEESWHSLQALRLTRRARAIPGLTVARAEVQRVLPDRLWLRRRV